MKALVLIGLSVLHLQLHNMSISRSALKALFETGDTPSQTDFEEFIDQFYLNPIYTPTLSDGYKGEWELWKSTP